MQHFPHRWQVTVDVSLFSRFSMLYMHQTVRKVLKLSTASCGEASILKE
jgi:hypothetical protein